MLEQTWVSIQISLSLPLKGVRKVKVLGGGTNQST